jgi:methionine synthase I (cobalamin-dependent)/5,10-methylenetetrahydrofolate reductase
MSADFLARLQRGPILCDGAMGTLLYDRGVFINRCYDELNLSQPDLVRSVHLDYLAAGAEIIETNTFGANSFRLARHGLADRVRDINLAGARLARACVHTRGDQAYVAGSIGPIGVRIEPLGKTARDEARASFRQQAAALLEGGVDLFMLETFGYLEEIHQAILACRDAAPSLPIVAMVTIDEDGNCLDGSDPETFTSRLDEWGADVVGCNCSVGPVAMLDAMEKVRAATGRPLAAQPNAGMPRNIEGRNIYLCSPEYIAGYARKFLRAGVALIGGCCGTTPEHVKAMAAALRTDDVKQSRVQVVHEHKTASAVEPPTLAARSRLGQKIASGAFATMVEIVPPRGIDPARELAGAAYLKSVGVDAINIPDSPRASARMSNMMLCILIQQQVGIETVLHYTCRDRNVLGIQSDLLGLSAIGLRNVLCITGDPPKLGNYPDATAVFDVDSIGLVNIVSALNHGLDIGGNPIGVSTGFTIGVGANPGLPDIDAEVRRFEYKVEAGAEYAITQPVFDLDLLERFLRRVAHCRIPVIAGIWPLTSVRNAEFMRSELNVSVPQAILDRMARASTADAARAEGVSIAREMLAAVRHSVQGAQISAPLGKYAAAADVLEALGSSAGAKV